MAEEIQELADRRRRIILAVVGGIVVLGILFWAWWDGRPTDTELVLRVATYEDVDFTRATTAFDVLVNGRPMASTVNDAGAREVRIARSAGTEIGISVRSTRDPDLTAGPRFHHVDPRLLPDVGDGIRAIDERFTFGQEDADREIRVRVLDERGEPLPGVYVRLDDELAGATATDGEMTFTVDRTREVLITPELTGRTFRPGSQRSTPETSALLTFTRQPLVVPELSIRVRVVREDGAPVPDVPIYLDGELRLTTDGDGRASTRLSSLTPVRVEPRLPGRRFTPGFQMTSDDQGRMPPFILMDTVAAEVPTETPIETPPDDPVDVVDPIEQPVMVPVMFTTTEPGSLFVNESLRTPVGGGPWTVRLEAGASVSASLHPTDTADRECAPSRRGPLRIRQDQGEIAFNDFDCRAMATSGLDFGGDYAAAEQHVRENLDDDIRIRFAEPRSTADHEMYGRLLWIRGQGYERRGLFDEAIDDLERSYEYRPAAATAIDLLAAEYESDPCGSLDRMTEVEEKAVQQGVSHAAREKLRAFKVFMYHCRYRRASDSDERQLWEARLCDAIDDYRRGVARGGTRRYDAEVRDVAGRVRCDR